MVKELKEFGVEAYGYDPLLSKEEIDGFGVKVYDFNLDVKIDCVIVAVAHDEFKKNPFLAQVLSLERKCDVRGMFDGKEAISKGLYYKTL
ncbi:hypothetical protein C5S32_06900 [ANME-1 cluster archaeon GoMg1]|nr:hypothetical protein [ANME-1 cluster archaeon GoMg1]